MSDITADEEPAKPRGRSKLLLAGAVLAAGLGAFAAGYIGLVSPMDIMSAKKEADAALPGIAFVEVPRIVVPMAGRNRQLMLSIKLEVTPQKTSEVEMMMPRVSDSFTRFLSDIDPAAIDRRGVLEIIRGELQARADMLLGADNVGNVLITEFAIQ